MVPAEVTRQRGSSAKKLGRRAKFHPLVTPKIEYENEQECDEPRICAFRLNAIFQSLPFFKGGLVGYLTVMWLRSGFGGSVPLFKRWLGSLT
jgi:hypothetical protein